MAEDTKKMALNDAELEKISGGVDIKFGYEGFGTVISGPLENATGLPWPRRYEVKADDGWTANMTYQGANKLESGTRVLIIKDLLDLTITPC